MVSLLVESSIATTLSNLDSSRHHNTSAETRTVGWTEIWGFTKEEATADPEEVKQWEDDEQQMVSGLLASTHPQSAVTLFQYRPAWYEQSLLRFVGVDHVVVNSGFAATESTGALPCLRVLSAESTALVGPIQPHQPEKSIGSYLAERHPGRLADGELSDEQQILARGIQSMIEHELNPILQTLRYQDEQAWDCVYRPQHIQAGSNSGNAWFPVASWFQAWSIRRVGQMNCQRHSTWRTIPQAKQAAATAYDALEKQLRRTVGPSDGTTKSVTSKYILGTTKPSLLDAMLWGHLAEALCDVHLIVILADFPHLLDYFQGIYEQHFRLAYDEPQEWKRWNHEENKRNAFNQVPLLVEENKKRKKKQQQQQQKMARTGTNTNTAFGAGGKSESGFSDAFELMQTLSVHTQNLKDVLLDTKLARIHEPQPPSQRRDTWFRWRMGGGLYPPAPSINASKDTNNEKKPEDEQQEALKAQQKQNDELWLTGVAAGFFVALALATSGAEGRE